MTREELRDYVDEQRTLNNIPYHVYSALIDGIDTLEQEPCEDAVSRKTIDQNIYDYAESNGLSYANLKNAILDAPSVTLTQRWIPVTERLPGKLTDVLIAFDDCPDEYDVAYLRTAINKNGATNEWVSSMGEATYADYEVSAWMAFQPYMAESEGKE